MNTLIHDLRSGLRILVQKVDPMVALRYE